MPPICRRQPFYVVPSPSSLSIYPFSSFFRRHQQLGVRPDPAERHRRRRGGGNNIVDEAQFPEVAFIRTQKTTRGIDKIPHLPQAHPSAALIGWFESFFPIVRGAFGRLSGFGLVPFSRFFGWHVVDFSSMLGRFLRFVAYVWLVQSVGIVFWPLLPGVYGHLFRFVRSVFWLFSRFYLFFGRCLVVLVGWSYLFCLLFGWRLVTIIGWLCPLCLFVEGRVVAFFSWFVVW